MVHKNIDITLNVDSHKNMTSSQIINAIKPTTLKRWLHILERSFRFLYSLLLTHDT